MSQQLVARIKKTSKYFRQSPHFWEGRSPWFEVEFEHDSGYSISGNSNQYRRADLVFGVKLENGDVAEIG